MNLIKIFFTFLLFTVISCSNDNITRINSPDNKIDLTFKVENGHAFYKVEKENKSVTDWSRLGIKLEDGNDIGSNLKVLKVARESIENKWYPFIGEKDEIEDNYNKLNINISKNNINYEIIFRIYNDGISFKYNVPSQEALSNYNIIDEYTEFNLSSKDTAWWIPGFSYRRYEFLYAKSSVDDISKEFFSKNVENISYDTIGIDAAHTPLTIKKDNGLIISIHEANLINYSSMTLAPKGNGLLEVELYPWSDGTKVKLDNKITSPWRFIQIADNSSKLLDSDIILNLNEDPDENQDFSWVKPGKYMGVWWEMIGTNESTWWQSQNHGANNSKVKYYLDFASKNNFNGLLVEGWNKGWHPEWCCSGNGDPFSFTESVNDFDINYLSSYGNSIGVNLVGHHETGGQIQNYENQLEDAFKLYNRIGVKNIKTGYVNDVSKNIKKINPEGTVSREWHHGQYMIDHFQKVIETAAKYKLNIIKHEPIKDTGLRRKYPNFISREGAKGQEFNGFSSNGVNHATDLPFTRLLSGPMDYTPGIFQLNNFRYVSPGSDEIDKNAIVPSTIAKELALYVVYYSPMQMAADLPKHYIKHPEAFEFIKSVPVEWSKKNVIDSKISEFVILSRKDKYSDDWYIGGITDEKERNFDIDLNFLEKNQKYKLIIYKDTKSTHWKSNPMEYEIEEKIIEIDSSSSIPIYMAPGGGFAIHIVKV